MNPVHTPAQHLARTCGPVAGALLQAGFTGLLLQHAGLQSGVVALSLLLTLTALLLRDLPWWRREWARRQALRPVRRDLDLVFRHARYAGFTFHPENLSVTAPWTQRASPLHLVDGWVYLAAPQRPPRALIKLDGAAPNPQAERQLHAQFGPPPSPASLN